jgi:hypothetical protein
MYLIGDYPNNTKSYARESRDGALHTRRVFEEKAVLILVTDEKERGKPFCSVVPTARTEVPEALWIFSTCDISSPGRLGQGGRMVTSRPRLA